MGEKKQTVKELMVLEYANRQGIPYKVIETVGEWNGYNVFHGYFQKIGEIDFGGNPLYLLEKENHIRFSTYEEGFKILDHLIGKDT